MMLRVLAYALVGLMLLAGRLPAFEVQGVVTKIDAEQRVLVVTAGQQPHTLRVPEGVKVLDAAGQELPDGLKAKDLREGARITIIAERQDEKLVVRTIRVGGELGGKVGPRAAATSPSGQQDTSGLIALTDLGQREYKGFPGGLYPEGKNTRPAAHESAGVKLARQVQPLGADGKPSADGKIVLLAIGFSNTVQAFHGFMEVAKADQEINPKLVLVNGAHGGMSAFMVQDPDDQKTGTKYWTHVDAQLKAADVTRAQVQVLWIKETDPAPHKGGFPKYVQDLEAELIKIVHLLPQRFPNAKLVYFSSRTYGGWALPRADGSGPGNSEPFSYESGFAYKWLIQRQLQGDPELNFDPAKGPVKAPWLSWATYLWTNGPKPRGDGVFFTYDDFTERDRMHESPAGQQKVGKLLLQFFKTDPTTRPWFVRPAGGASAAQAPQEKWEQLPDGSLGQVTEFRAPAGIAIPAYIRHPSGSGPFPVVVMLHGGGYGKAGTLGMGRSSRSPVEDFIQAGWAVFSIDYRPTDKKLDPREIDDTIEAVKMVRRMPFIDSRRVGLMGGSHGANLSSRMISRVDVQGAVLCAPAALDLIEVKKAVVDRKEKLVPVLMKMVGDMEQQYGAKAEQIEKDPAKFGYSSGLTEVAQVRCPILIVNGRNDDNSPTSIIDVYVNKLRAAGKQVQTYLPENGPHGFYFGRPDIPEWKESTRRAVAFFRERFAQQP
jgi:acetyl esterase/lipase/Cu/Ag efflux protein CusF